MRTRGISDLKEEVLALKAREREGLFSKRISQDLFLKVLSFCTAPSIARSIQVAKPWRDLAKKSSEMFRVFEMEGRGDSVSAGLEEFNRRCRNSIVNVKIKLQNKLSTQEKIRIHDVIVLSSKTIKYLSLSHQGHSRLVARIAAQCPSLKLLCNLELDGQGVLYSESSNVKIVKFSSAWTASLDKLVWKAASASLICDDDLIERLRDAREVTVHSSKVSSLCVVKLLPSASKLVSFEAPWMQKNLVREARVMSLPFL